MFHKLYKTYLPFFLIISFFCGVIFSSQDSYAQGLYKITDKIGGSGNSTDQTGGSVNSSTTLIIIGAAVIAGFLVYKLVINKDKPVKESGKDSTSNDESMLHRLNMNFDNTESEFEKYRQMPINFYAGIQKSDILVPERKLIMGISYNF
jgi:uncharacterized membrane protein